MIFVVAVYCTVTEVILLKKFFPRKAITVVSVSHPVSMKSFRRVLTSRSLLLRRRRSETHDENQTLYSSRLLFSDPPSSSSPTTTSSSSYVQSQNIFTSFNRSNPSSFSSTIWNPLRGQRRNIFIQTQSTPNPSSLMFYPGKPVMEIGSSDFPNARSAMTSPLAKAIYGVDGVTRVFFGSDFVTVTKSEDVSWDIVKPDIFAAIMDFYSSGEPLFLDSNASASKDTAIHEDDSETVAMIKELLETRIRPAVQDDGGDIEYRGFDLETGIVKLRMQGACSGCPSSSVTLKSGIENMLMHYVPEVKGVEQDLDGEEEETLTSQMD